MMRIDDGQFGSILASAIGAFGMGVGEQARGGPRKAYASSRSM